MKEEGCHRKHSDTEMETTNHSADSNHFFQFKDSQSLTTEFVPELNSCNNTSMTTVSECMSILCSALIHTVLGSVLHSVCC